MAANEPKLCPECPRKRLLPLVRSQSYTTTPTEEPIVKLCAKLRAYEDTKLPRCPHFPTSETLIGFFSPKKRKVRARAEPKTEAEEFSLAAYARIRHLIPFSMGCNKMRNDAGMNVLPSKPSKMSIYIIADVYKGILRNVEAFTKEEEADKYEKALCLTNGIPYDAAEREKYYEENEVDEDITKWTVQLQ